jgi:hypothetical protein
MIIVLLTEFKKLKNTVGVLIQILACPLLKIIVTTTVSAPVFQGYLNTKEVQYEKKHI